MDERFILLTYNPSSRNGVVEIAYNVFNKPSSINRNNTSIQFVYGADLARVKQTRVVAGKTITTYYVGKHYERETSEGNWRELSYISDAAIVRDGNQVGDKTIRFTLRDRLGSATTFADHLGNVTAYRYFDPFGKPRSGDWSPLSLLGLSAQLSNNPLDSDMSTRRGFTDHEHLDEAQLIHMNGRVYDYNLGRFLSVDPFIQSPTNSQSMNPYSYIMNNPLSGTDPTGYIGEQEDKVEVKEEKVDVTGSRLKGTKTTKTTTKANGSVSQRTTVSNGAGQFTSSSNRSGSIESSDNTKIGAQEGVASTNQSGLSQTIDNITNAASEVSNVIGAIADSTELEVGVGLGLRAKVRAGEVNVEAGAEAIISSRMSSDPKNQGIVLSGEIGAKVETPNAEISALLGKHESILRPDKGGITSSKGEFFKGKATLNKMSSGNNVLEVSGTYIFIKLGVKFDYNKFTQAVEQGNN